MKTLRLINLALSAIISVSLCACGDDDSNSPETPVGPSPQAKHITRIVQEDEDDGDKTEYIYSYDSQGRVTSMVENEIERTKNIYTISYEFTYGDNTITVSREKGATYTYSLLNGRITSCKRVYNSGSNTKLTSYTYDAQGHLATKNENDENITYTWEGGDLTEVDETFIENGETRHHWGSIRYDNNAAPANYMPIGFFYGREAALAMMGCFGKMPVHLPKEGSSHGNDNSYSTTTYTYRIEDGRPVKIRYIGILVHDNKPEDTDSGTYTIEWN